MHLVELFAGNALLPLCDYEQEDVQRRVSAFRSAQGVSLEAGLWRRSHQRLGKFPEPVLPFAILAPESVWIV